jgi:hypothetical protein
MTSTTMTMMRGSDDLFAAINYEVVHSPEAAVVAAAAAVMCHFHQAK